MHNVASLNRGSNTCTLQVHPDDAIRYGLADGGLAKVASRTGRVVVPVEVTGEVRTGVVSLPHGWGHGDAVRGEVARSNPGVNSNLLGDGRLVDAPTGTAVVNGIPVTVTPA
jgi:anaerobic selenocysteine-containing dehydrogenase